MRGGEKTGLSVSCCLRGPKIRYSTGGGAGGARKCLYIKKSGEFTRWYNMILCIHGGEIITFITYSFPNIPYKKKVKEKSIPLIYKKISD